MTLRGSSSISLVGEIGIENFQICNQKILVNWAKFANFRNSCSSQRSRICFVLKKPSEITNKQRLLIDTAASKRYLVQKEVQITKCINLSDKCPVFWNKKA